MKKLFGKLLVLVLLVGLLMGCAIPAPIATEPVATAEEEVVEKTAEEPAAAPATTGVFTVACVPPALVSPFHIAWTEEAKKIGATMDNVEVIVQAPQAQTDIEGLIRILEDMIEKKVSLIAVAASSWEAIAPTMNKAMEAGIPVVFIDRIIPVDGMNTPLTMMGSDEIEGGKFVGEFVAKTLNGKGNVAILPGPTGSYHSEQRLKGFRSIIEQYPDIKIVALQTANFQRDLAVTVMENILQANPKLDLVWGINDNMALGALTAIQAAGRQDEVKVIGYNGDVEALNYIKDGTLLATAKSLPVTYARQLMTEVVPLVMQGRISEVKPVYPIHVVLTTIDNVDEVMLMDK